MSPTQQRDLAGRLALKENERAHSIARTIKNPWFACQALAWVARYAPDGEFLSIIKESFDAGKNASDPFQTVGSAAWPIRALVERDRKKVLDSFVPKLLVQSKEIDNMASRSQALFLLFQAAFPAGRDKWFDVMIALRHASIPLTHWRQRRNIRDAALIVWKEDPALASEMISDLDDAKLMSQFERAIAKSEHFVPRPFFWESGA